MSDHIIQAIWMLGTIDLLLFCVAFKVISSIEIIAETMDWEG